MKQTLNKKYPFDWLTSRGRQTPEDKKWGQRKSGCEDRVEYTWGRLGALGGPSGAQASFPPTSFTLHRPQYFCPVLLDMQMEGVREHFKTSGMKFKIESCQIIGTQV